MPGESITSGLGRAVDIVSSSLFAGCVGFATWSVTASDASAAAAAAAAFVAAMLGLGRIGSTSAFALPAFNLVRFDAEDEDRQSELLLTELAELLLTETVDGGPEELLLDDRLTRPGDDSRVIRLFDPRTLPSAGELHERIDRYLQEGARPSSSDATRELHQALAELRRSLR